MADEPPLACKLIVDRSAILKMADRLVIHYAAPPPPPPPPPIYTSWSAIYEIVYGDKRTLEGLVPDERSFLLYPSSTHKTPTSQEIRDWSSLHFTSLSRIYLSRIVEKVPKNLSSYAPDQDEGNKQQCN